MWLRSLGSNYTWWGACFAGDVLRIDEYLQNGQDRTYIFWGVFCTVEPGAARLQWQLVKQVVYLESFMDV